MDTLKKLLGFFGTVILCGPRIFTIRTPDKRYMVVCSPRDTEDVYLIAGTELYQMTASGLSHSNYTCPETLSDIFEEVAPILLLAQEHAALGTEPNPDVIASLRLVCEYLINSDYPGISRRSENTIREMSIGGFDLQMIKGDYADHPDQYTVSGFNGIETTWDNTGFCSIKHSLAYYTV